MSQQIMMEPWDQFFKVVTEIGSYKYGEPEKKYPRFVSFQKTDKHFPSDGILESGPDAIRRYWNMKNLRRRKK